MRITTPLGTDVLMIRGFDGEEGISQLFSFNLDMFAEKTATVAFDKVLGQKVTVSFTLPGKQERHFNGIVRSMSRGARGEEFIHYQAEMVPQFWLFTKRRQSRIFQHKSVPDILKEVLEGIDTAYEIQGNFEKRNFCVQYHETDYDFACRLMEEEGIFYFFKHTADTHKMVVANTPQSHLDLPFASKLVYEEVVGESREDMRITRWEKEQELRSGKYTLWDHCFELPHKHLEAEQPTRDSVQIGRDTHKLKLGSANQNLEIYDWPGGYAKRFDGIDKSGGEQASEMSKIFEDNRRTVGIRMQQEEFSALVIHGSSDCRHMNPGFKFTLDRHFSDNGAYVLTSVRHNGMQGEMFRASHEPGQLKYSNEFTCIPVAHPFRPPRITPKPVVHGTQTAVVVGPSGEEIFTDKYGRIKIQFHWDREGKNDADSSCWARVASPWAGKNWGAISIPRIGQEVVVDFREGDPDQPIVVGSVYNADQMPPYKLPDDKTVSTLKSRSSKGGSPSNYNEIRMEDKKGKEQLFVHAEKNMDLRVKEEYREYVGKNRHIIVKESRTETVEKNGDITVKGNVTQKTDGNNSLNIGGSSDEKIGSKWAAEAGQEIHLKGGMKVVIEAGMELTIKGAGGFVKIDPSGVTIVGTMVMINSGGAAGSGSGASPGSPKAPDVADDGSKKDKL
jgi:type VI secretion system secreted protein VgrG